jgi:hypothetical protein
VPGAATHDDRHLAFGGALSANDPALDEGNAVRVERGELGERLGRELMKLAVNGIRDRDLRGVCVQ